VCRLHYERWRRLDNKGNKPTDDIERISNKPEFKPSPGRPTLHIGERKVHTNGYVYVKIPSTHMLARKDRYSGTWVLEHRLVVSEHLNRPLKRTEIIKHKDGDKTNNTLDNLYVIGGFNDNG